jgi:hypothetical protein
VECAVWDKDLSVCGSQPVHDPSLLPGIVPLSHISNRKAVLLSGSHAHTTRLSPIKRPGPLMTTHKAIDKR